MGEDEFSNFKRDIKGQGVRFHEVCVCGARLCVCVLVIVCQYGYFSLWSLSSAGGEEAVG